MLLIAVVVITWRCRRRPQVQALPIKGGGGTAGINPAARTPTPTARAGRPRLAARREIRDGQAPTILLNRASITGGGAFNIQVPLGGLCC